MAKGKKTCPECKKEIGARAYKCSCGYDFAGSFAVVSKNKEEVAPKVNLQKEVVLTDTIEYEKVSPKDHAERILEYGKKRATILLKFSKWLKCWSHVDWKVVEMELG